MKPKKPSSIATGRSFQSPAHTYRFKEHCHNRWVRFSVAACTLAGTLLFPQPLPYDPPRRIGCGGTDRSARRLYHLAHARAKRAFMRTYQRKRAHGTDAAPFPVLYGTRLLLFSARVLPASRRNHFAIGGGSIPWAPSHTEKEIKKALNTTRRAASVRRFLSF